MPAESPSSPRPFRTRVRTATRAGIEALNRDLALKGVRRYQHAKEAALSARGARSAVPARLASWIEHPDERVPVAMMRNPNNPRWLKGWGRFEAGRALLERALRDAEEEGLAWTPLLDELERQDLWSRAFTPIHGLPTVEEQAAKLAPWLRTREEAAEALELLRFRAYVVHKVLARELAAVDDAALAAILGHDEDLAPHLASNPHLSEARVERLAGWALQRFGEPGAPASAVAQGSPGCGLSTLSTLSALAHAGRRLPDETVPLLLRHAETRRGFGIACTILHLGTAVRQEQLIAFYDAAKDSLDEDRVRQLVRHPAAGPQLWRHMALDSGAFKVRRSLAGNEEACRDPVVRAAIGQSSSDGVKYRVARAATGEEFRALFLGLVASGSWMATRLLGEDSLPGLTSLRPEDLAPLLTSSNRETRAAALAALGRLGARGDAVGGEPPQGAPLGD